MDARRDDYDYANPRALQILLVLQILVGREQYVEGGRSAFEQLPVRYARPPLVLNGACLMSELSNQPPR